MNIALFVEGGSAPSPPRREAALQEIWRHLATALGLRAFTEVIPISKKHLVAMDPSNPKMSGAGEGLDQLIARKLETGPGFDAAVVAWDLVPAWNPEGGYCRWQETVDMYRWLGESRSLPNPWRAAARARYEALISRPRPDARAAPHRVGANEVVAVCMDPMLEGLLFADEQQVVRAFELEARPTGWPSKWRGGGRRPDHELLAPIIRALRAGPRKRWPRVAKTIRADERNKDPWIEYLLRRLLEDDQARHAVLEHPICRRLAECLG